MDQKLNEYKIEESKEDIQEIKETVTKIFDKLDGLVIQTSLNTASLKRVWWFVGIIAVLILGVAIKAGFAS